MKMHTVYGCEIVKNTWLSTKIANIAFSIMKNGMAADIRWVFTTMRSIVVGIVALADVYDALTSDRVYKKGNCRIKRLNI